MREGGLTIAVVSHRLDARPPSPSALNGTDQREVPIGGVTKWHDLKPSEGLRESEGCRQSNDCCAVRLDERNGGVSVILDCCI